MLQCLQTLAGRYSLTRTVHLAQSTQEVRVVKEARGMTPAEYLDSFIDLCLRGLLVSPPAPSN